MATQKKKTAKKAVKKTTPKKAKMAQVKKTEAPLIEKPLLSQTGIPALDEALNGGLPAGACVLLAGGSGVGKTILAMQWLFNGFKKYDEPGIYITTTEPVFKALRNLNKFAFFDQTAINPMQLHMTDLRSIMQDLNIDYTKDMMKWQDVENVLSVIKNLVEGMGAKRLVLDSVTAVCYRLKEENLIRTFIFRLGTMLSNLDCTTILTSEVASADKMYSPFGIEEFIADGILKLNYIQRGEDVTRALQIVKMRGTNFDPSPQYYVINKNGHNYFSQVKLEEVGDIPDKRLKTGILGLDKMIEGGVYQNSTTLLTGSSGTGKTVFGLKFLAEGVKEKQRCLLLNFEESKAQIYKNAKACPGIDLEKLEKEGLFRVVCRFPESLTYEEHLQLVKEEVEKFKPDRVVIDSLSSLEKGFTRDNLLGYAHKVNVFLKSHGSTNIIINASEGLFQTTGLTQGHISTIPDNIVMLKYVEIKSVMKRFITVIKVRGSDHDKRLREYVIKKDGIHVMAAFKGVQGVLTGNIQHEVAKDKMLKAFKDLAKEGE